MNDTFNPLSFDLTKNLHGHVRVETRSRWTGKVVDSQEKDNLVTNAAQMMLQTAPWADTYFHYIFTPIYEKLLGAVMLFGDTLTEQASNIYFPASAKIVGYAGQVANTTNVFAGSINTAESVKTSNGFTTVWDFLTSQANGTIASLARTFYRFADDPICNASKASPAWNFAGGFNDNYVISTSYTFMGYDKTNKDLFIALRSTQSKDGVSYPASNIYKCKADFDKISMYNFMPPAKDLEVFKSLTSSDGSSAAYNFVFDKFDRCFLYATGTTLHVIAMDGTHSTKTLTGTSSNNNAFAVTEHYYWRSTGNVIYRITKTNTADVQTYNIANGQYIAPAENDVLFVYSGMGGFCSIIYPDGTIVDKINPAMGTNYSVNTSLAQVGPFYCVYNFNTSSANYMYPMTNYLGTIANLDSPVTKTSSQTMKITYTLTEA